MNNKKNVIIQNMKSDNIDIVFFNDPIVIQYLTGYESEPHERILAYILLQNGENFLFTPALEAEDARKIVKDTEVFSYLDTENPWQVINEKLKSFSLTNWGIEKGFLTVERKEALEEVFPNGAFNYNVTPLLEQLRLQKDEQELAFMKEAGYWADEAIKIGASILEEGITELEVVAHIEYTLKKRGITAMSFDTMVLFGENAASPHGNPGKNKLKQNQFVLFDLGVFYKGYTSDITRTLFFGTEPSKLQTEVYETVLLAHDTAMEKAYLDMKAEDLDHVARSIIEAKGYGPYFNHRLGHGLGQSVHEFPSIMAGNDMPLKKNMCFSIEPGIYLPGQVGVRIEDCGYIDETGFHSFTSFPTHLQSYRDFIQNK